ncbi:MAG: methyltransferase [Actinobacteria bacterium]|nr:methyltransferase [Actinomycetota bacterium]
MQPDPERQRAQELADYWTPFLLRMFGETGIFAAFGREARTGAEVAVTTSTDADTLERMLRALVSRGVFERLDDGRHRLTRLGRRYLTDEPGNVAGLANFKPWELHAWADALHTLRTGEPSFARHFGATFWEWLAANPREAATFNDTMRRRTASLLDAALPSIDWPEQGTVVDVGGGNGLLLERLLAIRPELRGVIFDLPHVVDEARAILDDAGVGDRVEVVGGDFFEAAPPGHDLYVLASVLHDWQDDDAVSILGTCRRAMPPSGRLTLFEAVLGTGPEFDLAKMVDLHMLVLFGARERTRQEWERLLERGGFVLERVTPTPGLSWIEARPATT